MLETQTEHFDATKVNTPTKKGYIYKTETVFCLLSFEFIAPSLLKMLILTGQFFKSFIQTTRFQSKHFLFVVVLIISLSNISSF